MRTTAGNMSLTHEYNEARTRRSTTDGFSGRTFDESKCADCGEWMSDDEVVWINPATGETTTGEFGKPYHDYCAPD